MQINHRLIKSLIALTTWILVDSAWAGFKVGNGDDGVDLENGKVVEKGPLITARQKALERLKGLNVSGIRGLGAVLSELEKSTIYLASADVPASLPEDEGNFHSSLTRQVFARTFAERGAATRVFPAALKLDEEQQEALLIHEALHRALPESVREDESVVGKLTLAMIAEETSHDQIRRTAEDNIPEDRSQSMVSAGSATPLTVTGSRVGYSYRHFLESKPGSRYPIKSMHTIHSQLYPFGARNERLGLGIEITAVSAAQSMQMGPLGLSFLWKALEFNGFELSAWGVASLTPLSADEVKNSPFGRDLLSLGISIYKPVGNFYVENIIGFTSRSKSESTVGSIKYAYEYGSITQAKIRSGLRFGPIGVGGFVDLHLAEYFRVKGGSFAFDSGRYRIFSAGPEMIWKAENWELAVFGRVILDSTRGADFDFLGDLMGPGVARGSLGSSFSILF